MALSGKGRKPTKITGTSFRHRVAQRIRARRLELELRVEDVSSELERLTGKSVNIQTIYHWEKGEHPFDIDWLPAIAAALKVSVHDLIPK